jgi:hypothetical protein
VGFAIEVEPPPTATNIEIFVEISVATAASALVVLIDSNSAPWAYVAGGAWAGAVALTSINTSTAAGKYSSSSSGTLASRGLTAGAMNLLAIVFKEADGGFTETRTVSCTRVRIKYT